MQRCDYTPEYKPGRELVLPDMLPRAPLPETTDNKMEEEIALHVHLIQSSLTVSKLKLEEIREETAKDESLKDLIEIIKRWWPEAKACQCVSNSTRMGRERWTVWTEGYHSKGWKNSYSYLYAEGNVRENSSRSHRQREIQTTSTRCVTLACGGFWNSGKYFKMQYMPTTPKAKWNGANDSLLITKQTLGKGSNRSVHLG